MDTQLIHERILSESYADILAARELPRQDIQQEYASFGAQSITSQFVMLHAPLSNLPGDLLSVLGYYNIPKLYTTLDITSLERSGITQVLSLSSLDIQGEQVLIGFLDTGIAWQAPAFRNPDGTTRIAGIWDQTIQAEDPASWFLNYGTVYTEEQINQALFSSNSLEHLPTEDLDGHGTLLASIAGGSPDPASGFTGAAPGCRLAMVRLKPAKNYLKQFFLVPDTALAFQETDLLTGISYLQSLAASLRLPLVLCIGLGTTQGDHAGGSPLNTVLNEAARKAGFFPVAAAGNEAGLGHHFYGQVSSENTPVTAELLVSEDTLGFSMELWGQTPERFALSVTSPLGETIPELFPRLRQQAVYSFALERTILSINYELAETQSGNQLILLRFFLPTPGIWQIHVRNTSQINGQFHIWLPIAGFLPSGTQFLAPDPDTTLTDPGDASGCITASTYNAYDGSLYIHSSRGYTRTGAIKPDLAAPGVSVTGLRPASGLQGFRYTTASGSSVAAAITAGSAALLAGWLRTRSNPMTPTAAELKNLLILGASRSTTLSYPNRAWGYGALNLYGIFQNIR